MPPSRHELSRRKYQTEFTWVKDTETGHRFAAPYPADRLPDHLEPLNEPALDRNGDPRPPKLKQPIRPTKTQGGYALRKSSPSPEPDPAAGGANGGEQADHGQPSTAQANEEATK